MEKKKTYKYMIPMTVMKVFLIRKNIKKKFLSIHIFAIFINSKIRLCDIHHNTNGKILVIFFRSLLNCNNNPLYYVITF